MYHILYTPKYSRTEPKYKVFFKKIFMFQKVFLMAAFSAPVPVFFAGRILLFSPL